MVRKRPKNCRVLTFSAWICACPSDAPAIGAELRQMLRNRRVLGCFCAQRACEMYGLRCAFSYSFLVQNLKNMSVLWPCMHATRVEEIALPQAALPGRYAARAPPRSACAAPAAPHDPRGDLGPRGSIRPGRAAFCWEDVFGCIQDPRGRSRSNFSLRLG